MSECIDELINLFLVSIISEDTFMLEIAYVGM